MGGDRRIVPGQLWRWTFNVGDGFYMWQRVTSNGRVMDDDSIELVYRDDLFMVMVVDDPGPYQSPIVWRDIYGNDIPNPTYRWHVVLLRDTLYWFRHDWFFTSELLCNPDEGEPTQDA